MQIPQNVKRLLKSNKELLDAAYRYDSYGLCISADKALTEEQKQEFAELPAVQQLREVLRHRQSLSELLHEADREIRAYVDKHFILPELAPLAPVPPRGTYQDLDEAPTVEVQIAPECLEEGMRHFDEVDEQRQKALFPDHQTRQERQRVVVQASVDYADQYRERFEENRRQWELQQYQAKRDMSQEI